MLLNCGVGEDSWESLGLQGDQLVNPKGNQPWILIGRTDAGAEAPILWPPDVAKLMFLTSIPDVRNWLIGKDPDAGKDWWREEKETNRGWDGWMASPTQWTWVWAISRSWWWTGKPGVLQPMGSQSWTGLSRTESPPEISVRVRMIQEGSSRNKKFMFQIYD